MSWMFYGSPFNGDISKWDVSVVNSMSGMFRKAFSFNQSIGHWNVRSVEYFDEMFSQALSFNQNLCNWFMSAKAGELHVSSQGLISQLLPGSAMTDLCDECSAGISTCAAGPARCTDTVGSFTCTCLTGFAGDGVNCTTAALTNQELRDLASYCRSIRWNQEDFQCRADAWDTSGVSDMSSVFALDTNFDLDIGRWNTSAVTDMSAMFYSALFFNQDIGAWDTSSVSDMRFMFQSAASFNQNIDAWDTSKVTQMQNMFQAASSFDQNLCAWDVSSLSRVDLAAIFSGSLKIDFCDECLAGLSSCARTATCANTAG
eukprot:1701024-Rhodomonas_salina.1